MIGAIALAVLGVAALASTAWFGDRHTFISFFEESVNGLERGAAVKFQGVPVGTVSELLIQIDQVDKTFLVPVEYEIDLQRLTTEVGAYLHLDEGEVLRTADRRRPPGPAPDGEPRHRHPLHRAHVPSDADLRRGWRGTTRHPEIPTTPSLLAAFGTEAGSLVADVLQILFRVNEMLEEVDMQGLNSAVVASAQAVERLVGSRSSKPPSAEVPEMADQFSRTLTEFEELGERRARGRSAPVRDGGNSGRDLPDPSGRPEDHRGDPRAHDDRHGIGLRAGAGAGEPPRGGRGPRTLAITLERNPDMLIRGPRPPEEVVP
jgi:paraquat-inducible protein B